MDAMSRLRADRELLQRWRRRMRDLKRLARRADRKAEEYHAEGLPVAAEIETLIGAVLTADEPDPGMRP
jgi:hypothetical protein